MSNSLFRVFDKRTVKKMRSKTGYCAAGARRCGTLCNIFQTYLPLFRDFVIWVKAVCQKNRHFHVYRSQCNALISSEQYIVMYFNAKSPNLINERKYIKSHDLA